MKNELGLAFFSFLFFLCCGEVFFIITFEKLLVGEMEEGDWSGIIMVFAC